MAALDPRIVTVRDRLRKELAEFAKCDDSKINHRVMETLDGWRIIIQCWVERDGKGLSNSATLDVANDYMEMPPPMMGVIRANI